VKKRVKNLCIKCVNICKSGSRIKWEIEKIGNQKTVHMHRQSCSAGGRSENPEGKIKSEDNRLTGSNRVVPKQKSSINS
jgi:hypothetical protein